MQLQEQLSNIQMKYPMFELRLKMLKKKVIEQSRSLLEGLYNPPVVQHFVTQFDIFGKQIIEYMEEYDTFTLMETKVMDNVLKKMWRGSIDTGGSFFAMSTCFKIATKEFSPSYKKDYERTHRLRVFNRIDKVRHHPFTFKVFRKGMDFRYYIELLLYLVLSTTFQYFMLRFVTGYQSFADLKPQFFELVSKIEQKIATPADYA